MSESDPALIERLAKNQSSFVAVIALIYAICAAVVSVESYIVPMFNSWGNLFGGMLYLGFIFLGLHLFSFSIRTYTLWAAKETRLLEDVRQSSVSTTPKVVE